MFHTLDTTETQTTMQWDYFKFKGFKTCNQFLYPGFAQQIQRELSMSFSEYKDENSRPRTQTLSVLIIKMVHSLSSN